LNVIYQFPMEHNVGSDGMDAVAQSFVASPEASPLASGESAYLLLVPAEKLKAKTPELVGNDDLLNLNYLMVRWHWPEDRGLFLSRWSLPEHVPFYENYAVANEHTREESTTEWTVPSNAETLTKAHADYGHRGKT
jgi:hypothetical protein